MFRTEEVGLVSEGVSVLICLVPTIILDRFREDRVLVSRRDVKVPVVSICIEAGEGILGDGGKDVSIVVKVIGNGAEGIEAIQVGTVLNVSMYNITV